MKTKFLFKGIALFALALFGLTACSSSKVDVNPDEVLKNFQQNVKEIKAMDGNFALKMTGVDDSDNITLTSSVDIKADRRDQENRKFDMSLKLDGSLAAEGKSIDGKIELMMRVLKDEFYVNLMELESSDSSVQSFAPFLAPYKGNWLHVSKDFIPENLRDLNQTEESAQKEEELKNLFANASLFKAGEVFGVETIAGKKVIHMSVELDRDGLTEYIRQASSINGREMTEAEVAEAASIADSVIEMEMWIGQTDHFLYKGMVELTGENLEQGVESGIELVYTANSYNQDPGIDVPADYQEFNPLALLGGLQLPPAPPLEVGGDAMMEKEAEAMMEKEL